MKEEITAPTKEEITAQPQTESKLLHKEIDTSWIEPEQREVYRHCLTRLKEIEIPFILAGAFALYAYTGIRRNTKDLDVFLPSEHVEPALSALEEEGFRTEVRDGLWLAKAHKGPYFVDLIFSMPNKEVRIDMDWIRRSGRVEIFGMSIPMISLEELILSKIYVARMDRFDGADIAHLIRGSQGRVDWTRILRALGVDQPLLLWHFIFFQLIYPGLTRFLPTTLMDEIYGAMRKRRTEAVNEKAFRGMLIDPVSFAVDCEEWGFEDIRDTELLVEYEGTHNENRSDR